MTCPNVRPTLDLHDSKIRPSGLLILGSVIGFFLVGLVPISFNFSGEMAYPESEATSSALLQSSGDMLGVVIIEISKYLVQLDMEVLSGERVQYIEHM